MGGVTYGTSPMVFKTEGRLRMPREMVSAIMIMPVCLCALILFSYGHI